jgi:hypothetical protein
MVDPVALSTSALLLPERRISRACLARRPKTTEQFSTRIIGSWPSILCASVASPLVARYTGLQGLALIPSPPDRHELNATQPCPAAELHDMCFSGPLQLQGRRKLGLSVRLGRCFRVWALVLPFVIHRATRPSWGAIGRLARVSGASRRPSRSSLPCWAGRRCSQGRRNRRKC